jgi:hypothetical protein
MKGAKMFKRLFCIVVFSCIPLALLAQDVPQVEVFAGYSYLRAHDSTSNGLNQDGWDVSASFNFARNFGVVADFSNHYGTKHNIFSPIGTVGKGAAFLFGPQYTFRRGARPSPFVHALFGGIQANKLVPPTLVLVPGGGSLVVPGTGCTTPICYESVISFAMALGGGLDVRVTDRIWIRAFQADYFRANLKNPNGSSAAQNDSRLSAGIVFRFGKR